MLHCAPMRMRHPQDPVSPRTPLFRPEDPNREHYITPPITEPPTTPFLSTIDPVPLEEDVQVPDEPFPFRIARVRDAAMSPFFHNFVDDIRTVLTLEEKEKQSKIDGLPLWVERSQAEEKPSSESTSSLQVTPRVKFASTEVHFGCYFNDCDCEKYDPHLFLPYSLAGDEDWPSLYGKIRELIPDALIGFAGRGLNGRYIKLGRSKELRDERAVEEIMNYIEEYRRVKIMMEVMREKDRREHDPFNPKNWNDEYAIGCSVGKFDLLCKCGHATLWHHSADREKKRKELQAKQIADDAEEKKNSTMRRATLVDIDLCTFDPVPVEEVPEKEEDDVQLIGGKLIRKKKNNPLNDTNTMNTQEPSPMYDPRRDTVCEYANDDLVAVAQEEVEHEKVSDQECKKEKETGHLVSQTEKDTVPDQDCMKKENETSNVDAHTDKDDVTSRLISTDNETTDDLRKKSFDHKESDDEHKSKNNDEQDTVSRKSSREGKKSKRSSSSEKKSKKSSGDDDKKKKKERKSRHRSEEKKGITDFPKESKQSSSQIIVDAEDKDSKTSRAQSKRDSVGEENQPIMSEQRGDEKNSKQSTSQSSQDCPLEEKELKPSTSESNLDQPGDEKELKPSTS